MSLSFPALYPRSLLSFTPAPWPQHLSHLSLSLNILLLIDSLLNGSGQILIRRGNLLLLVGGQLLVRRGFVVAAVAHPQEDDGLSDEHADGAGGHTECDTDQDGDESDLDRDPQDMGHAAEEAFAVPLVVLVGERTTILRLEVVVAGELHGAVWAAMGDASRAVGALVVVVLVAHHAHDAVEAFDAEALDLVSGGLGGGLDSGDAAEELGHDAAHHIAALSVGSVWGGSDGGD